jgi:hypothetical protein
VVVVVAVVTMMITTTRTEKYFIQPLHHFLILIQIASTEAADLIGTLY